jgi:hypothetical protein
MKSPIWPYAAQVSRIVVFGLRCDEEAHSCSREGE